MKKHPSVSTAIWWQRSLNLGLTVGLSLGLLRLIGAALGSRLSLVDALTGTLASLGLYVIAFGAAGLLTLARWHASRLFAIAVLSFLSAALVFTNVLSTVLHWLSGTYLTVGSIAFTVNSWSHVAGAAISNYTLSVLALFTVTALVMVGAARYLSHPQDSSAHRRALSATPPSDRTSRRAWLRRTRRGLVFQRGLMIVGCSLFAYAVFASDHFAKTLRAASPELTLLASWQRAAREIPVEERDVADAGAGGVAEAHAEWKASLEHAPRGKRPNILLVALESVAPRWLGPDVPDAERDHRWLTGKHEPGRPLAPSLTPHLDQLKRNSVHFSHAWSTATHSNYAQMAILSSLFPRRGHGLDVYDRLDYPRLLLHDAMSLLDYQTATISSQDENWQGMLRFQQTDTETHFWHSPDHDGAHVFIGSEHIVPDHITREHAVEWVRQQSGPWSLYLNLQATHFPYRVAAGIPEPNQPTLPSSGHLDYFGYTEENREIAINRYKNALAYVDAQIGALRAYLESSGQIDNTLWIVTSDHGELFHEHGMVTHGQSLFEEESRVPLLIHWPEELPPQLVDEPVSHLDVMPTLLGLLGVAPHPSFQGRNLAGRLRHQPGNAASPPQGAMHQTSGTPAAPPSAADSKLATDANSQSEKPSEAQPAQQAVLMNIQGLRTMQGIVCWPWKLTISEPNEELALFSLYEDPGEQREISARYPEVARRLAEVLDDGIDAQLRYHLGPAVVREQRFAPRIANCPTLAREMARSHLHKAKRKDRATDQHLRTAQQPKPVAPAAPSNAAANKQPVALP